MKGQKNIIRLIIVVSVILALVSNLESEIILRGEGNIADQAPQSDVLRREQVIQYRAIQPDGTIIMVEMVVGGQNNPFAFKRLNEFSLVRDESKYYCWARQGEDGNLKSTGYAIHLYDPEELGLEKDIRFSDEFFEQRRYWMRRDININRRE